MKCVTCNAPVGEPGTGQGSAIGYVMADSSILPIFGKLELGWCELHAPQPMRTPHDYPACPRCYHEMFDVTRFGDRAKRWACLNDRCSVSDILLTDKPDHA